MRSAPLLFGFGALLCCGCSVLSRAPKAHADQDVLVSEEGEKAVWHKSGERFPIAGDRPTLFEAPGRVSLLVIPEPLDGPTELNIQLKTAASWERREETNRLSSAMDELILGTSEAQKLAAAGQPDNALIKIGELEKKYPDLLSLPILEANVLVIQGENSRAKSVLLNVIRHDPDNRYAKQLLQLISGGER